MIYLWFLLVQGVRLLTFVLFVHVVAGLCRCASPEGSMSDTVAVTRSLLNFRGVAQIKADKPQSQGGQQKNTSETATKADGYACYAEMFKH